MRLKTWRNNLALRPAPEPRSAAVVCLSSSRCRWGPPRALDGSGWRGGQKRFWLQKTGVSEDLLINNQRVASSNIDIAKLIVGVRQPRTRRGHTSQF
jgi:hypothetical protein